MCWVADSLHTVLPFCPKNWVTATDRQSEALLGPNIKKEVGPVLPKLRHPGLFCSVAVTTTRTRGGNLGCRTALCRYNTGILMQAVSFAVRQHWLTPYSRSVCSELIWNICGQTAVILDQNLISRKSELGLIPLGFHSWFWQMTLNFFVTFLYQQ